VSQALLDPEFVANALTREAPWCGGHGADGDYLGLGLLYYTLVYATRAEVAVCLGSGGGFVPRLMRQAQRDAGIADRSRTILVDGNVPQAGWGAPAWLGSNSFFRTEYPDVELVLEKTTQAAETFFAPQDVAIAYLHIDADHSFEACLEDFYTYRRFLRPGSLVTFHDTNFAAAGVGHVVDHLRTRGDCEVVDFLDQGVGTALVRITEDPTTARRAIDLGDGAIRLERRPDAPVLEPPTTDWRYLTAEAFRTRSVLAAHYVRECDTVVEIGGWRSPIDRFLTGAHGLVVVVDPFVHDAERNELNGAPSRVRHVRARFQDLRWQVVRPKGYGLVMLGLELEGLSENDYAMLFELVENANVTVVEFPTSWDSSRAQFERIRSNVTATERLRVKLDLGGNDLGDLSHSWPARVERELYVLG